MRSTPLLHVFGDMLGDGRTCEEGLRAKARVAHNEAKGGVALGLEVDFSMTYHARVQAWSKRFASGGVA